MPSRHKLKKTSSATTTTSECSKELRELSDKDYRELLASVAGLPIRTLSSESGGLSGGDVLTSARENEKLTPAARSCLEKIVGEIENNNNFVDTKRTRTGKCATFDDSFMTRRIEAFSAFSSTKKKPVRYEKEDMKFIDEDNDVEMMDLSGTGTGTITFTRGNQEQTATEYKDDDVESGFAKGVDGGRHGFFEDWKESSLLRNGRLLNRNQTILGPQSEGSFHPITEFITGTDVIPSLTPAYEMAPLAKPVQSSVPTGKDDSSSIILNNSQTQLPNGITNNFEDVMSKNAVHDVAPNTKMELGKRKKGKKEKKENVVMAETLPGHMGQLSVEQLVHLIEGSHSEQQNKEKKQGHKDKSSSSSVVVENLTEETSSQQTKKERRRKSKELKENTAPPSAPNAVTIGAQQTKTGGSAATAAATAITASSPVAPATSQSPKMEFTVANKRVTSPISEKRRGKGSGAERTVRCSTEDGEEEFLSADEGVASSIEEPGLPRTVPATSATTTNTTTTTSAVSSASEVVLDGRNYRADDEDVTQIERQFADEQEFITVNTKKKKAAESSMKQQQQRTGSAGKDDRHQRVAERLEPARRSSLGVAPEARVTPAQNSPLPSGRRPTTASLGDFLDGKDVPKIQTKPFSAPNAPKNVKKFQRNERHSQPDVEVPLPELPVEQRMSKPATQSVTCDSPERTFSYADAAKKSSEPSRDNSPACVAVASPSAKSDSPAPQTPTPVAATVQENSAADVLSCADVPAGGSGAAGGLSFFYDESEAAQYEGAEGNAESEPAPDSAFVLNLGGKTVRFAKGMASPAADTPPTNSHHMCMVEMLAQRWKMFQEGHVPQIYQPRIASS